MLKLLLLIGIIVGVYYLFFKKKALIPFFRQLTRRGDDTVCQMRVHMFRPKTLKRDGKHHCSRNAEDKRYSVTLMYPLNRFIILDAIEATRHTPPTR